MSPQMEQLELSESVYFEQVRQAQANYYELFDKANAAILIMDAATGKIIDANSMATQLTGYSKCELINKHPYDTISSLDSSINKISAAENLRKAIEGEHIVSDRQYIHKKGHVFWVQVRISKVNVDNCERIIVSFHGIDNRKKAEEALRKSEANLRSIFQHTNIGFALLDQSFNIVCCNDIANEWGRTRWVRG